MLHYNDVANVKVSYPFQIDAVVPELHNGVPNVELPYPFDAVVPEL